MQPSSAATDSSSKARATGAVVLLLAAAGAGYAFYSTRSDKPEVKPVQEVKPAPEQEAPPQPKPLVGPSPLPVPTPSATPVAGYLGYPDGTWMPPLNGVKEGAKVIFHRSIPFTKVVGKMQDAQGREWYVHENGARSTAYVDATGRVVAMVDAPVQAKPQLPEETGEAKGETKK